MTPNVNLKLAESLLSIFLPGIGHRMPIDIKFIRAKFACDCCGAPTGIDLDPDFLGAGTVAAFVEQQIVDRVGGCSYQCDLYLCQTCTIIVDNASYVAPLRSIGEIRQVILQEYRQIEGKMKHGQ